jgi:hypothetical protein
MGDSALLKLNIYTSRSHISVLSSLWFFLFVTQFMCYCTYQNLTRVLLKLRPHTSHCYSVYFLYLCRWFHYFFLQFTRESNFQNQIFILPDINTCTSHSHTFVLPSSGFCHLSSTSHRTCTSNNWIFVLVLLSCILLEFIVCTTLFLWTILFYLQHLEGDFALPIINLYTSRRHCLYTCHHYVYITSLIRVLLWLLCVLPKTEVMHFRGKEFVLHVALLFIDMGA